MLAAQASLPFELFLVPEGSRKHTLPLTHDSGGVVHAVKV